MRQQWSHVFRALTYQYNTFSHIFSWNIKHHHSFIEFSIMKPLMEVNANKLVTQAR